LYLEIMNTKFSSMNIRETFLKLTNHTYPHGTEHGLFDFLPQNLEMDQFGNLFIKIGESDTMFTSHLDTATSANVPVNHVFEDNIIKTDGKSILGADDKAGVTIMLSMIEKQVPGLYYFFLGEEVGCIGSKKVAEKHKVEKLPYINKVVSFDRRGLDSVISFQASKRCCSDEFAVALATELNKVETTFKYLKDPTGVYTDSAQFVSIYPECTNISVGYYSEHTYSERQDIDHLTKLAEAVSKIDWTSLPTKRDPSVVEYDDCWDSYYGGGYSRNYNTYDSTTDWSDYYTNRQLPRPKESKIHFHDVKFNFVSSYVIDNGTAEYTSVDIHEQRIDDEREAIYDFLTQIECEYSTMAWNGIMLSLEYLDGKTTTVSRKDLIEYLPQLNLSDLVKIQKKELSRNGNYDHEEFLGDC